MSVGGQSGMVAESRRGVTESPAAAAPAGGRADCGIIAAFVPRLDRAAS